MDGKTEFEVTEKAGAWVAGMRSPGAGRTIELTEEQAHFALLAGELRRTGAVQSDDAAQAQPKDARRRKAEQAPPAPPAVED